MRQRVTASRLDEFMKALSAEASTAVRVFWSEELPPYYSAGAIQP